MEFYKIDSKGKFFNQQLEGTPTFDSDRDIGRQLYSIADEEIIFGTPSGGKSTGDFLKKNNNLSDLNNVSTARSNLGLGSAATRTDTRYLHRSNNLSDLNNVSTARSNLGLGSAATRTDTRYLHRSNNLSDVSNVSQSRSNLGLGSAATQTDTRYLHRSNNLSDVSNVSQSRSNLGLGNISTKNQYISTSTPTTYTGTNGDVWYQIFN